MPLDQVLEHLGRHRLTQGFLDLPSQVLEPGVSGLYSSPLSLPLMDKRIPMGARIRGVEEEHGVQNQVGTGGTGQLLGTFFDPTRGERRWVGGQVSQLPGPGEEQLPHEGQAVYQYTELCHQRHHRELGHFGNRMRMMLNGRQVDCPVQALNESLVEEVRRFVESQGLEGIDVSSLDDLGLSKLDLAQAQALGWPRQAAARVLAKIAGLNNKRQKTAVGAQAAQGEQRKEALRQLAIQMLRRDDELRLSDATQRKYAAAGDDWSRKYAITVAIQKKVAREFGFGKSAAAVEVGLDVMRGATSLFPNDPEIINAAHYLRHNIHAACPIPVGHKVPLEIPLFPLDRDRFLVLPRAYPSKALAPPPQSPPGPPPAATAASMPELPSEPCRLGDVVLRDPEKNGPPLTCLMVGSHT